MSDFLRDYLTVVWFAAIALVLAGILLGISALVRPSKPSTQKLMAYESGVNPVGDGWSQSQVRYYIFALLFVMFDVEAVFIFPWAVNVESLGWFGLVEMAVFVVILTLGLVYAWRKGVLRWA
jgi:NADH-quinone oxidoreductase subunit A